MNFRSFFFFNNCQMYFSPPQRLPLGIPIKISIIDKNRKRAGNDGKRETACPARSLFLSPQPPHNTKASPQYKEASAEERANVPKSELAKGVSLLRSRLGLA